MAEKLKLMGRVQFAELCEELKTHRERLLRDRPSYESVTHEFGKKLQCRITVAALHEAMRHTQIEWKTPVALARESLRDNTRQIAELSNRQNELTAEIANLRGAVGHLYSRLGETPPPGSNLYVPVNSHLRRNEVATGGHQ